MKKTVLTYGLISGAILSALMAATVPFAHRIGMGMGMVIGYTTMVLSFLLVFFGVRSYRETAGKGYIGFWRAFQVGILIALISSICYVITWEIIYFNFLPDFADKYAEQMIERSRAAGATAAEIAKQVEEAKNFKALYNNPIYNIGFTFLEPMPVALLVSIFSALVLRKRPPVRQETEMSYAQSE